MVLLKCVVKFEENTLMKEIHEGTIKNHTNGYAMAIKILRAGYYLMTMEVD